MRLPRSIPCRALAASTALLLLASAAQAAEPKSKPNGDAPSDLAPLDQSGTSATDGPVAHQNTPPIGGATQGGGGNPKEMGSIDTKRAQDKSSAGDKIQPDNK